MTYLELKIALDIGDPKTVLSSLTYQYVNRDLKYYGCYFIVCDDGDCHCFSKDGIEQKIEYIPHDCFFYDQSIVKINLEGIESIGCSAFSHCRGLTGMTIPDSVKSIGDYAFSGCNQLIDVTIGNGVTNIMDYAFNKCSSLTGVTIPTNVKTIGEAAFFGCSKLKSITIGNGVTRIEKGAFYNCSRLKHLTIPNSVMNIGKCTFKNCDSLKSIVFEGKTMRQIKAMDYCPWEIEDMSVIQAGL